MARLLVIMGSGETSPTMSKVHRGLLARLGPAPVPAVLLDTPYGFQENASDISDRAVDYFAESVRHPIEVAGYRTAEPGDVLARETALARIRAATYVFSGPGSPSYALAQWIGGEVPPLLADKLRTGGCVTFASAAACTLGAFALPVYEIYKVGRAPHWLDGLDLLAVTGMRAVVIPHFNNAEGGNHDTRYCYMGERRLSALEATLPDDVFVLGVDEHTALVMDLDAGTAEVAGLGGVTVRGRGGSAVVSAGETIPIDRVAAMATAGWAGPSGTAAAAEAGSGTDAATEEGAALDAAGLGPLLEGVAACEKGFADALATGDASAAVRELLELDDLLVEWSRDTTQSDHLDRGRAALRAMLVRLGEAADAGLRDPRQVVGPFVDALLDARRSARAERRFAESDAIRDRLAAAGIEVRDTPDGTQWELC